MTAAMNAPSAHSQRTLWGTTPKTGSMGVIAAVKHATRSATPISTMPGGVTSSPWRRDSTNAAISTAASTTSPTIASGNTGRASRSIRRRPPTSVHGEIGIAES